MTKKKKELSGKEAQAKIREFFVKSSPELQQRIIDQLKRSLDDRRRKRQTRA